MAVGRIAAIDTEAEFPPLMPQEFRGGEHHRFESVGVRTHASLIFGIQHVSVLWTFVWIVHFMRGNREKVITDNRLVLN